MHETIRERLGHLQATLGQLERLLRSDPKDMNGDGLALARTAIALDAAATKLGRLTRQLAGGPEPARGKPRGRSKRT